MDQQMLPKVLFYLQGRGFMAVPFPEVSTVRQRREPWEGFFLRLICLQLRISLLKWPVLGIHILAPLSSFFGRWPPKVEEARQAGSQRRVHQEAGH